MTHTHLVLSWQTDDRRLGREARKAIATADIVWVSAVSGREASIQAALGRSRLDEKFRILVAAGDFTELPVTLAHAERLLDLPPHHSDPFVRLLVAQALAEQATLVTHDRAIEPYGAPVIWTQARG
ncbi:MAG: hypothetical protein RJA55_3206 [Acidobacteriota bacterium]